MRQILRLVKDNRGAETLEWTIVGAFIVAVGIAVYSGTLQPTLQNAVTTVETTIQGQASS